MLVCVADHGYMSSSNLGTQTYKQYAACQSGILHTAETAYWLSHFSFSGCFPSIFTMDELRHVWTPVQIHPSHPVGSRHYRPPPTSGQGTPRPAAACLHATCICVTVRWGKPSPPAICGPQWQLPGRTAQVRFKLASEHAWAHPYC